MSRPEIPATPEHGAAPEHSIDEAAWARFVARHCVGDVVGGRVVSVVPFGAFIRAEGIDGFAPQSQWPSLPGPDADVEVTIEAIDPANRRVAFSPA
jgi:ribosomal protein S1